MSNSVSAQDNLKIAQQGLEFEDIFQTQVQANIAEQTDPKYDLLTNTANVGVQFKHSVLSSVVIRVESDAQKKIVFRVNVVVGIRYTKKQQSDEHEEAIPAAQIEAQYSIDYRLLDEELLRNKEALNEFALKNASYHLWPFWREFAMAQAQRMSLPPVSLPLRLPE